MGGGTLSEERLLAGPWSALPRSFSAGVRKEEKTLAAEIIREIRHQVPEFSRPLDGKFGAGIQYGVETALAEFADRIEGSGARSDERLRVYRALGRGELAEGRSLDALQAAFRTGARVAWRRYARVARRSGLGPDLVVVLAEAIFTHIDEMASVSVQGYVEARADRAGTLGRSRRTLLEQLIAGAPPEALARAAADADWPLPTRVACVALGPVTDHPEPGVGRRRLPDPVLADLEGRQPWLLLPEPEALLRDGQVQRVLRGRGAVIGPTVPVDMAGDSLRWARAVRDTGAAAATGLLSCDDRLPELLLRGDASIVRLMASRRLGPLAALTPKQNVRLGETLLAWLQTDHGSAPAVAARLGIHPQTARQRLHRVQELFGDDLTDPDARFELEVALRGRSLALDRDHAAADPSGSPAPPPRRVADVRPVSGGGLTIGQGGV